MSEDSATTKKATKKAASKKAAKKPLLKRDENGLIEGVDYKFDEDGFIDWRAMVSKDMLYPNRDWFARNDQSVPESIDGLGDHQLLIKLGGLKKLLRLRGYTALEGESTNVREGYVKANVSITFTPNFETDGREIVYTDEANASDENTDGFGEKFLETFAWNRAFARCIRNFLNINIVSAEEMDKSNGKAPKESSVSSQTSTTGFSPQDSLQNKATQKGFNTFPKFMDRLRELWADGKYKNDSAGNWKGYEDIPAKDARALIALI